MICCCDLLMLILFQSLFQAHMVYSEHDANFFALNSQVILCFDV